MSGRFLYSIVVDVVDVVKLIVKVDVVKLYKRSIRESDCR